MFTQHGGPAQSSTQKMLAIAETMHTNTYGQHILDLPYLTQSNLANCDHWEN